VTHRRTLSGVLLALSLLAAVPAADAQVVRYVHFQQGNGPSAWGILEGETIQRLSAAPFLGGTRSGQSVALSAVTLLPPATPSTAIITNVNYSSGLAANATPRERPTVITLPPGAFVGNGAPIMRPVEVQDFRAEATAAVVIGRRAVNVTPEQASQYIFGVAPAIDVTAEDYRPRGSQWTRAKGTDSFKPIGPAVVTGVNYNALTIVGRHNGTALPPVQTSAMLFDFNELVSYISQFMTLNPGDVVMAGTAGPTFTVALQAGDTFEVDIAGVGTLRNPVRARAPMTTLPPSFQERQAGQTGP
jgi:2-keto-4-pentenoate hydratase/2-oxohepta-3-ene-1,7-dioic acid hydratase in catechol pathway